MKQFAQVLVVCVVVALLSACAATWRIYAECQIGGPCTAGGEVKGQMEFFRSNGQEGMLQALMGSSEVFDAAQLKIDPAGSSVTLPNNGTVSIKLVDSSNGTVQAAKSFAWIKSAGNLVLANPDAVNNWAMSAAGSADSVSYDLYPFTVGGVGQSNTLSLATKYEGVVKATASTTWSGSGGGCGGPSCSTH